MISNPSCSGPCMWLLSLGTIPHKQLMGSWHKYCKQYELSLNNNHEIRSQFCTCHGNLSAMACANLWPDWIIQIRIVSKRILRFQLWAYESLVKCVLPWPACHISVTSLSPGLIPHSSPLTAQQAQALTLWHAMDILKWPGDHSIS